MVTVFHDYYQMLQMHCMQSWVHASPQDAVYKPQGSRNMFHVYHEVCTV